MTKLRVSRLLACVGLMLPVLAVVFGQVTSVDAALARSPSIVRLSLAAPARAVPYCVSGSPGCANPPKCSGHSCDNTDPYQTNCATGFREEAWGDGWNGTSQEWQVNINYSSQCKTVWASLVLIHGSGACYQCTLDFYRILPSCPKDGVNENRVSGTLYSGAWTNQFYLPNGSAENSYAGQGKLTNILQGDIVSGVQWPYPPYCL